MQPDMKSNASNTCWLYSIENSRTKYSLIEVNTKLLNEIEANFKIIFNAIQNI